VLGTIKINGIIMNVSIHGDDYAREQFVIPAEAGI